MKFKYIFLLAFALPFSGLNAQETPNPVNTTCNASERLCMGTLEQDFDYDKDYTSCWMNATKLYYYFRTSNDLAISLGTMTTSVASTYKIYGPFDTHLQGCEQLNEVVPTPAASGSASTSHTLTFTYENNKVYILEVSIPTCHGSISIISTRLAYCGNAISCTDCIKGFQPEPGKYVISAWVKEESALPTTTNYTSPSIIAFCPSVSGSSMTFTPSGQIIDGWQQIDGIYTVPPGATDFRLQLASSSGYVLFDDVRMFPVDGSMMSYVYDPLTLRLAAELDERNYAKLYEYDEEGKLVRVKKETEKGIMTIQENRENSVKE